MPQNDMPGFSLIEMMVVLAIVAIIAGVAAPNLQSWIKDNRIEAAATQVRGVLNAARSRSIANGAMSRVEFGNDELVACSITDTTDTCDDDAADAPFHRISLDSSTVDMGSDGFIGNGVTFDAKGRVFPRQINGQFTFCDDRGSAVGLRLSLKSVGRTTIESLSKIPDSQCL